MVKLVNKISFNDYIDSKKYQSNLKKSENDLITGDYLLNKNIKEMIPERNFASIVSGRSNSSLVSKFIYKVSNPTQLIALGQQANTIQIL